jgi:hypothetical protein
METLKCEQGIQQRVGSEIPAGRSISEIPAVTVIAFTELLASAG